MSHIATIKVEVKDLDALKAVAERLGLEFREGQKSYKWYGRSVGDYPLPAGMTTADLGRCDHALRVKGNDAAYEIGIVKSRTSSGYQLLWDFYSGGYGLTAKVGNKAERLIQGYAAEVAKRQAQRQGFRVISETVRQDGKVEVVVAR